MKPNMGLAGLRARNAEFPGMTMDIDERHDTIHLGQLVIFKISDGKIHIENMDTGEAGVFSLAKFEAVVREFFNREF